MKRIFSAFLALFTLLSFSACEEPHTHVFGTWTVIKEATCVEEGLQERVCACGEKQSNSISATNQHSYTSEVTVEATFLNDGIRKYTCSVCGDTYEETIAAIDSNWKIGHYVDEFGDETEDAYVIGTFSGEFSNSATSGSPLTVLVYLDKDNYGIVQFRLFRYDEYRVTLFSSELSSDDTTEITLKVKDSSGAVETYPLSYRDGDFSSNRGPDLENTIMNNASVSCLISVTESYTTLSQTDTYKFKIDNLGLQDFFPLT